MLLISLSILNVYDENRAKNKGKKLVAEGFNFKTLVESTTIVLQPV
jgi:hypothetical protein